MKKILLICLLLFLSRSSFAQSTTVSGQVTDSGAQSWNNGTITAVFVINPSYPSLPQYIWTGGTFNSQVVGTLNGTGGYSLSIPSNSAISPVNSQWRFQICSQASSPCFYTPPVTITGATQTLNFTPPVILINLLTATPPISAYADVELTGALLGSKYYNLVSQTERVCKVVSGNNCLTWIDVGSGSASAAGSPPQTQVNDPGNPGHFGGTTCESFPSLTVGPENVDCDWHAKGFNPYVDITRFGARTCIVTLTPCAAGITGSISNGSATLSVSSASTFINGDGLVVYGAGSAISLATPAAPTVTNVLAQMGTGTDLTVPGATGSTTKCYKIIARTTLGGYTPASPETCTTTGQATLGIVTVNLSGCTRAITTVTCTTSSPHPVLVGGPGLGYGVAEVYIGTTTPNTVIDPSFRGWRSVISASDSTHFSFVDSAINSANGAATTCSGCGSGGTATFFTANHLSWTAVTNAWLYYIYGGASGAETLIGVSRPQNIFNSISYTTWDDFSNLMGSYTFPPWIPTTPPSAGANNNLSTTIVSGAGTTTLTLANSAGATVPAGTGVRLDSTPAFLAAAAFASLKGILYIPADPGGAGPSGASFQISSYCDLTPYNLSVVQNGQLYLHETLALNGQGLRYNGNRLSANIDSSGGNNWGHYAKAFAVEAIPGIYLQNGNGLSFDGVNLTGAVTNGALLILADGGGGTFNESFQDDTFGTGSSSADLMGFGLIVRSVSGIIMDRINYGTGMSSDGASHNTAFYCNGCGDTVMRQVYSTRTGMIFNGASQGSALTMYSNHYNGGFTPLVSIINSGINSVTLGNQGQEIVMDTVGHPCLSAFGGGTIQVYNNGCSPTGYSFVAPSVTGGVQFVFNGNQIVSTFNNSLGPQIQATSGSVGSNFFVYNVTGPGGISVGYNNDSVFVQSPPTAAPTCSVSTGGSIPLGTYNFTIVPTWWNGQPGNPSAISSNCTTTTGNQTITVNWSAVAGNPQNVRLFVNGNSCSQCLTFIPSITSTILTNITGIGSPSVGPFPLGGPSSLLPSTQGISTPSLLVSAPLGSSTQTSIATASRSVIWPDNYGTPILSGYINLTYDNFNRANGGLGSNWTTVSTLNAPSITSNQVLSTGNNNAAYWSTNTFANDQFSQATFTSSGSINNQLLVRMSGGNGYSCAFLGNASSGIYKITGGGFTSLVTGGPGTYAVGDLIRFEVVGTTLNCFQNGALVYTVTDSTYASGAPGFNAGAVNAALDNWSGGNLHPISQLDAEQDWTKPQHFTQPVTIGATNPVAGTLAAGVYSPRYTITGGAAPTCAVTGAGTGATCTMSSFSTDNSGAMQINSGTTPGSSGTWTLTFSAGFPNAAFCTVGLGSGGTTLNARATVFDNTNGTLGVHAGVWDNNAVAINASQAITFIISYVCGGH